MEFLFHQPERELGRAATEAAHAARDELAFLVEDDPAAWAALQRLVAKMDQVREVTGSQLEDAGPWGP